MAALAWLLIPVVAAVVAGLWGGWAGRRRTTTPDAVGVAGYERFRAAMERGADSPRESAAEAAAETAVPVRERAVAHSASGVPGRAGD